MVGSRPWMTGGKRGEGRAAGENTAAVPRSYAHPEPTANEQAATQFLGG
jgi:hypothetical protein